MTLGHIGNNGVDCTLATQWVCCWVGQQVGVYTRAQAYRTSMADDKAVPIFVIKVISDDLGVFL